MNVEIVAFRFRLSLTGVLTSLRRLFVRGRVLSVIELFPQVPGEMEQRV